MSRWRSARPDDPVLAPFRDLVHARERDDIVIVEGEIAVGRALESGWPVEVVLATEAAADRLPPLPEGAEGRIGSAAMLQAVAGFSFHRGCLAAVARPRPDDAAAVLRAVARGPEPWTIVMAEALADPVNVGAVVRNARAFGAAAVALAGGADPLAARAVRASMGHVFSLPVARLPTVDAVLDAIASATDRATVVAATIGPDAVPLRASSPPSRLVLLVGAEGPGLSARALSRADVCVTIPTAIDSLNVAAATAVLLYALAAPAGREGSGAQGS